MTGLAGHYWTIAPALAARLGGRSRSRPTASSFGDPWSVRFHDPAMGEIALSGRLATHAGSRRLALVVHGLGGSIESPYAPQMGRALLAAGWSVLLLNLRGADRASNDLHHAGFTDDFPRVLAATEISGYAQIAVLGFSLGGHLALRYAAEQPDPRLVAVVSICGPLDLERSATSIDAPARWLYRRYLLQGMNEVYVEIARRREVPVPPEQILRLRTIREWDGLVVAPRFGFDSAEDYYRQASVAPILWRVKAPSLMLWSEGDPLVPPETVRPALGEAPRDAKIVFTPRGGHVAFPDDFDLGEAAPRGLESQVAAWLDAVSGIAGA